MARKNPNQYPGILITIKKIPGVKLPLPCQRLHRRVLEFLQEARVRSTEYTYTLTGVTKIDTSGTTPVTVTNKLDTTLEFGLTITLGNGELFVGNLRAPVKCKDDRLSVELARAAAAINSRGWHETAIEKQRGEPALVPQQPHQQLIKEMQKLLRGLEVELGGVTRDIERFQGKKREITRTMEQLRKNIETLSS